MALISSSALKLPWIVKLASDPRGWRHLLPPAFTCSERKMRPFLRPARYVAARFEEAVVIVCMIGISILTFVAVLARYVFRITVAGADEIATVMFIWAAIFGAAAGFKYNQHGSVPILANRLSPKSRRCMDLVVLAVIATFFFVIAYNTWIFVGQSFQFGQTSPATGLPAWIPNAGLALGLTLCGVRCVEAIARDLWGYARYPGLPNHEVVEDS